MTILKGDGLILDDVTLPAAGTNGEVRFDPADNTLKTFISSLAIWVPLENAGSQLNFTLANGVGATNVTGLVFDKTTVKAVMIKYEIERSDDAPTRLNESGWIYLRHQTQDDTWEISSEYIGDDSGTTFSVVAGTGQVQYATTTLVSTTITGVMRAVSTKLFQ